MGTADEVPDAAPVSDSSASSSESLYGSIQLPLHCQLDCIAPADYKTVPGEVGGESFRSGLTEKHVSFGDTEVRKYPVILGDHPECSMGPPVSSLCEWSSEFAFGSSLSPSCFSSKDYDWMGSFQKLGVTCGCVRI
jgi:hypothetical protein